MLKFEEVRTVTADGRVVIPWTIQRALGLEHGGRVRFRVADGVVTVHAANVAGPHSAAAKPRQEDRSALMAELRTLMDVASRDGAKNIQ
jgi:bifunctional DNA-binding transcriptional regulator/antitoxin component of YhaV-PrlF toxin-antitoxin module